jgi:predicted Ser/Thr protein kinase
MKFLINLDLMDDPLINKIDESIKIKSCFFSFFQDQIEFLNFIGRGGQGLVQRGKYRGQDVAIKSIVVVNDEQIINFIQEIKILR